MGMWSRVILSVAFVLMLAGGALAQCRVEGVVKGIDGTPVADATVVLDVQTRKTTTDAEGKFSFDNVKAGSRVQLFASKAGRPIASAFVLVSDWIERVEIRERPPLQFQGRAMRVDAAGGATRAEWPVGQETGSERDMFGDIRGVVRSADGTILPEASLSVEDPTLTATADAAGRFAFVRLAAGLPAVVHAAAPGFTPATLEVVVPSGKPLDVNFTLKPTSAEDTKTDTPNVPLLGAQPARESVSVRGEQVSGLPSLGERDVLRAVRLMPGVDGSHETSSGIGVRGGTPDQSLVTYDGIALYNVDHLFGYLSALNGEAIQKAEFSDSAVSAADGGRLSGILRLTGQSRAANTVSGSVHASLLNYGGFLSVPFGNRGALMITGRHSSPTSIYDKTLDLYASAGAQSARGRAATFTGGVLRPAKKSSFYDLTGKLDLRLSRNDRVSATVYDASSDLDHSRDLAVPTATLTDLGTLGLRVPADSVVQTSDLQNWNARGVSGSWMHQWSSSASTTLLVSHSQFSDGRDWASLVRSRSTGVDYSIALGRGGSNAITEANEVRDTTLRLDSQLTFGFAHLVSLGVETKSLNIDYLARTEVIQGIGPTGVNTTALVPLLNRSLSGRLITVFAQDGWTPTPRLLVSPGMRVTYYDRTGSSYFEPRLSLSYQATSQARFRVGAGIDDQMVNRVAREDLMQGDREFWTLADGSSVPVARSQQVFAGGSYATPEFLFDIQGYYRVLDDLAIFAPRLIPGVAPAPGATLFHQGSGTAIGAEVILQHKASWHTGWVSYSLSKVDYEFPTLEASQFPASQDHRHDAKVTDILRIGARWTLGATWMISTGLPVTPASSIEPVWLPTGVAVYRLAFGAKNSDRVPLYHRLDLSTQREFRISAVKATLGVGVFNVYNRKNIWFREFQVYAAVPTSGDMTLLGRTFNVFAKIGF
jgi:ferric enterobactin receptor